MGVNSGQICMTSLKNVPIQANAEKTIRNISMFSGNKCLGFNWQWVYFVQIIFKVSPVESSREIICNTIQITLHSKTYLYYFYQFASFGVQYKISNMSTRIQCFQCFVILHFRQVIYIFEIFIITKALICLRFVNYVML